MERAEFYQRLAEILDGEEVQPADGLTGFDEWDSLSVLSVLAMADSKYGVTIDSEEIQAVVTASDLAELVARKLK